MGSRASRMRRDASPACHSKARLQPPSDATKPVGTSNMSPVALLFSLPSKTLSSRASVLKSPAKITASPGGTRARSTSRTARSSPARTSPGYSLVFAESREVVMRWQVTAHTACPEALCLRRAMARFRRSATFISSRTPRPSALLRSQRCQCSIKSTLCADSPMLLPHATSTCPLLGWPANSKVFVFQNRPNPEGSLRARLASWKSTCA
mmetsp:Transcript_1995/g.7699  ORF Transcript_1995/g.7699 Transcript_1995/m.7699 type:complete len:209 (-) Transcript_1995:714-1340(-)